MPDIRGLGHVLYLRRDPQVCGLFSSVYRVFVLKYSPRPSCCHASRSVTFFGLMGPHLSVLSQGQSAAVDVFDTLRRQPVIDPSLDAGKRIRAGLEGKITFKDLFFAYPSSPDRPIFYDFNLTIEPGQSVALVG